MQTYTITHKGNVRSENEDSLYISGNTLPVVAAVADGMGGHNAGKVASETTVRFLSEGENLWERNLGELKVFAEDLSDRIYLLSNTDPELENMGTTLSMITLDKGKLKCAHIGDSRVYLLKEDGLKMLSVDHSYVQMLIDMGAITKSEAENHPYKNVITRAVGTENVKADVYESELSEGDGVLICSDGLIRHVSDEEIENAMREKDCKDACEYMLSKALERGGSDNISIVMIKLEKGDLQ